jgi:protein-S-isoprenylcysteine O-methyltransferase Ste14
MIIVPKGASTTPASPRDQARGMLVMAAVALAIALFVFVQPPHSAARPPVAAGWGMLILAVVLGAGGLVAMLRTEDSADVTPPNNNQKEQ